MPKSAATVAVATPCWPAPVSAMSLRAAHALGEEGLAQGVVEFVGAGVGEVLALQIDLGAAAVLGEAGAVGEAGGAADVVREIVVQFLLETRILARGLVGLGDLEEGAHERLGDVDAAEAAEAAGLFRCFFHIVPFGHRTNSGTATELRLGRSVALAPRAMRRQSPNSYASRTAAMKSRSFCGSFLPGAYSTPPLTSTA